jgi:nucleoside triphosphate diphosphatase
MDARMDPMERLLAVMARLRDPQHGCAWDLAQDFASIAPYTLEEAYEVADAVARGDLAALREELGDLLLQVVFHARMAEEGGAFDFAAVAQGIADKLVRRHPHVFGAARYANDAERRAAWEAAKAAERAARDSDPSALAGVARALPALKRAVKLQDRAARVGFDWPDLVPVLAKAREELGELEQAIASGDQAHAREELGDVLFVLANVARHLGADAEAVLAAANDKFERRFRAVEARLRAHGHDPAGSDLATFDAAWDAVKAAERTIPPQR